MAPGKAYSCVLRACCLSLIALLAASGCLYLPATEPMLTEEIREGIVVGRTTRSEVETWLKKPDLLETSRFSLYDLDDTAGDVVFIVGGGYSGGVGVLPLESAFHRVLLEYDDGGVVQQFIVETGFPSPALANSYNFEVYPGWADVFSPDRNLRKLLLEVDTRDWLGFSMPLYFSAVEFISGGQEIVAAAPGFAEDKIWLTALNGEPSRELKVSDFKNVAFGKGLDLALIVGKDSIASLRLPDGAAIKSYEGHGYSFWGKRGARVAAISPDGGRIGSGGGVGDVHVWNPADGTMLWSSEQHEDAIAAIGWSPDAQLIASVDQGAVIKLWDAADGTLVATTQNIQYAFTAAVAFSPDSRLLGVNFGSHVEIYRLPGLELDAIVLLPYVATTSIKGRSYGLEFSPDGNSLAASNGALVLYDIESRQRVARFLPTAPYDTKVKSDAVLNISFSADGSKLAAASPAGIHIWLAAAFIENSP